MGRLWGSAWAFGSPPGPPSGPPLRSSERWRTSSTRSYWTRYRRLGPGPKRPSWWASRRSPARRPIPASNPIPALSSNHSRGSKRAGWRSRTREQLVRVLTYVIVNPPLVRREDRSIYESPEAPFPPELIEWVRAAIRSPLIAVEESPLSNRSIAELTATATTTALYFVGAVPVLVLIGGPVGLVIIRGIHGLGGALWEGARPEVVTFGRDLAHTYLDILRARLGITVGGREDR